jgi:hypothetical protein
MHGWSLPLTMLLCVAMVVLTVMVHYEGLRLITDRLVVRRAPRQEIIFVILGVFLAHTIEVWLFAFGYALSSLTSLLGQFRGDMDGSLLDYMYFSATTYTSLGIGDVYPVGGMRLLTGVEALVGLVMIGWSASYTYLVMEQLWRLQGPVGRHVPRLGQRERD